MSNTLVETAQEIKRMDDRRPGFPGEHWLALGAGILLLVYASRHGSPLVRSLTTTLGTAFIGRAAAGRDGVRKLAS